MPLESNISAHSGIYSKVASTIKNATETITKSVKKCLQNVQIQSSVDPKNALVPLETAVTIKALNLPAKIEQVKQFISKLNLQKLYNDTHDSLEILKESPAKFYCQRYWNQLSTNGVHPCSPRYPIQDVISSNEDIININMSARLKKRNHLNRLATPRHEASWLCANAQPVWCLGGCSSAWHHTYYLLLQPRKTPIQSPIMKEVLILTVRDTLIDNLLIRFGTFKQYECVIIRQPQFKKLVHLWATYLVETFESPSEAASPYYIPLYVLQHIQCQEIAASHVDILWLLYKIHQEGLYDAVPKPHFPRIFECPINSWPYDPQRLKTFEKYYGLLKWPFIHKHDTHMLKNKLI